MSWVMRKTRSAPPRELSMLREFRTDDYGSRPPDDPAWLLHSPERWLQEFNSYGNGTDRPQMGQIRAMRLIIQHQTFAVCRASKYFAVDSSWSQAGTTDVPEGVPPRTPREFHMGAAKPRETRLWRAPPEAGATARTAAPGAAGGAAEGCWSFAQVRSTDCLEQARAMSEECSGDERVAVMNMANAYTPGGGFRAGCGAQEENMHRRSDLCCFLEDERACKWGVLGCRNALCSVPAIPEALTPGSSLLWNAGVQPPGTRGSFYPIPDDAVLYSKNVRVFRGPETDGYPMLIAPFSIDGEFCCNHGVHR